MKNKILFLGLISIVLCTLCITSCAPDYETEFEVKTLFVPDKDLSPIVFNIEGGQQQVRVETNLPVEKWKAESNAAWCKVEKSADKIVISATNSNLYLTRVARVTIEYGHIMYSIPITQKGLEPVLLIDGKRNGTVKEVPAQGGTISVAVSSNLELDNISIPDTTAWLKFMSVTSSGTTKTLTFEVDPTFSLKSRYSTILLQSSQNFDYPSTFVIKQNERIWGDPIPVELRLDMLSANATQSGDGQGLPGLIDNNMNTFYHTLWSNASPGGKPHYLQIELDEPLKFISIEYHGRGGGNAPGDVKRAGIWVSNTGNDIDSEWTKATTVTYNMNTPVRTRYKMNEGVAYLGGAYKYIRFIPEARRNADPIISSGTNGWWNMADIFLYTFEE